MSYTNKSITQGGVNIMRKLKNGQVGSVILGACLALVGALLFGVWFTVRVYSNLSFKQKCEGYIKQAADANSPELALEKLNISIKYIEANNLTSGSTAIVFPLPSEDLGFWYKNLKEAQKGLSEIKPDATPLEKSNQLMKLRETLLDKSDHGEDVTVPEGISIFPNNALMFVIPWFALVLIIVGCVVVFASE